MAQRLSTPKKLVLTGCTGFVGRELVPELERLGVDLLLVGREVDKVRGLFPGRKVCEYADLPETAAGYDAVVHLAALNNDSNASEALFRAVNIDLAVQTAQAGLAAGVAKFVHVSSFHTLDPSKDDRYARSKRQAEDGLRKTAGIDLVNLYLPAVYGRTWSGKLRRLNRLPRWMARVAFQLLAAMRPTVNVNTLASCLAQERRSAPVSRVLLADEQDHNPFYRVTTRLIDLAFAVLVVLALGWFLVVLWTLIRLESRGPGIFAQARIGRGGEIFTCYKFRTMYLGTQQAGTHEVVATSITRIGRLLRATKLDELPQLINIFRNEISLVGPRPGLPVQEELATLRVDHGVLTMKPGITGYAQIQNVDMSDPLKLAILDAQYKAIRSIPLNLRIILATLMGRGQGDKIRE